MPRFNCQFLLSLCAQRVTPPILPALCSLLSLLFPFSSLACYLRVANFSVATSETYKDKNGERQKRTEWHKIVVWGKQAEIAQQYLKKGSLIFIEGRIQSREWQDKEGQKRTSFEIVASNFRMLGGRSEGAAAASAGGGAGARSGGDDFESHAAPADDSYGGGAPAGGGPEISDEDIPF